ncbi:MAG: sulfite exporter TauE/SafE family protein [Chloroflexota bacterium]
MSTYILVLSTVFLAIFTQSLTGFGSALVSMALLTQTLGLELTAPLIALVSLMTEIALLLFYRRNVNLRVVWQLSVGAICGIPLGVVALKHVDEGILLSVLGAVLIGYALYALLNLTPPGMEHKLWAVGLGFLAGLLGGAYNTSGPPVIVYGNCRGWSPAEFKGNLQGFFLLNSVFVVLGHAWSGNYSPVVWKNFLIAVPAIGLGLAAGLSLDKLLNPERFRKIVLGVLILLGLRLLF